MTATRHPRVGAGVAHAVTRDLCARLGLPELGEARPGADLAVRRRRGLALPPAGVLLAATDGWVHPGPPTAWPDFAALARSLGARPGDGLPDVSGIPAEALDAEAGAWMLPVVAVRAAPAPPPPVPAGSGARIDGARVVVTGSAWAAPLAGLALACLGARVVSVEHPRRPDPFPLRDDLARGQERRALDLDRAEGRAELAGLLGSADLLVEGHPRRVLANAGFDDAALRALAPSLSVVALRALEHDDRPGYGMAAECRGGWAARHDPPRLGRTSVADPVAGLLAALTAAGMLIEGRGRGRARISLEAAVGLLHAAEAQRVC